MPESESRATATSLLVAEFTALRDQLQHLSTAGQAIVALHLTVVGSIAGIVLTDNAGNQLLLLVPAVASPLALLYADVAGRMRMTADYIDQHLRPIAVEYGQDDRLMRWESSTWHGRRRRERSLRGASRSGSSFPAHPWRPWSPPSAG